MKRLHNITSNFSIPFVGAVVHFGLDAIFGAGFPMPLVQGRIPSRRALAEMEGILRITLDSGQQFGFKEQLDTIAFRIWNSSLSTRGERNPLR